MKILAFDTETHIIQPGLLAPPIVCGSSATLNAGDERLLTKEESLALFRQAMADPDTVTGGANFVYDLGVMSALDPSVVELIFKALEEDRVVSADLLEALHDNARGLMFREANGSPFKRYSLAQLESRYLGIDRSAEKKDGWRMKYHLLDGKPFSEWPEEAIAYPRRDARGTANVLAEQLFGEDRHNLQCIHAEMRAAWFLQLACIWGMRTDPEMVKVVTGRIVKQHEESRRTFFDHGITRVRPCTKKDGEYEEADDISEEWLKQAFTRLYSASKQEPESAWRLERLKDVEKALAALSKGRPIRFAEDKKHLASLVEEAYQGDPPLTSGGQSGNQKTSTSRDTLVESGNELLEEYGEAGPNEKLFSTYVKVLEQGTVVPINPEANVIVATQRTSYREPNLQQIPQSGLIRECFVPRKGWVYNSCDYAALELCTFGQICIDLFGKSTMAEAINKGEDLHLRLGARFYGCTYEEALVKREAKDPTIINLRKAAKPFNFGVLGLMGPPKIVLTARKQGVRFCELAGVSEVCGSNKRVTRYKGRAIAPTCCECLKLAQHYHQLVFQEWEELAEYHQCAIHQAEECGEGMPLESFGTGMKRLETNANAVANHFFQNRAAQGAKHAGWLIAKESYADRSSVLFNNLRTVVFVHDETFAEIREEVLHEAAYRQAELMIIGMQEFVPDVKITVEPAAMRRWFKGAEKAFNKQGRLKPYWPAKWDWAPDQVQMAIDKAA